MSRELELDLRGLVRKLDEAGRAIGYVARLSLQDIMDDWKREAINVAPLKTGTLRRSIHYRTRQGTKGVNVTGELTASAIEVSPKWGRFNYAYYIHEVKGDSFKGRVTGTIGRFLDVPAEQHEAEWMQRLEADIKAKIRGLGL